MNIKELRQRDAELKAEIAKATKERAEIGAATIKDKRALTDEERAAFVAKGEAIDKLKIELADNDLLLQAEEDRLRAEREWRALGDQPDPDQEAARLARANAHVQVEVAEPNETKATGYFGRQLQAIRTIALAAKGLGDRPTSTDYALVKPMQAAATGLNTDVASEGGFLVSSERSNTILQRAYTQGQILSRVTRQPIGAGANGLTFNAIDETSRANGSRFGGIVSTWVGQGTSVTSGKPKFRQVDMKLRKIMATLYATDEQLNDAIALEGWINRYLPLELIFRAEDAIINGTGSNQPLGVLNSGALITVTRSTTDKVVLEDVQGMHLRMWAASRPNAVWLGDQSIEAQLENLHYTIGTGGAPAMVYRPVGLMPGQTTPMMYGKPVLFTEYGADLATVGDLVLVDLSEYIVIDKGGVDQAVSIHVAFLTDEQVFRFIYRIDGQLTWNSALTPKSGGSTLSCAIALSTNT